MEEKKCVHCGKSLPEKRSKYCSNLCYKKYYYKKKYRPCVICGFDKLTVRHHIIERFDFGSDDEENIVILCPNHHRMVHNSIYSKEIQDEIYKKTGKKGKRLTQEEIKEKINILKKVKSNGEYISNK